MKERSKHQRYVSKKNEELKNLLQEVSKPIIGCQIYCDIMYCILQLEEVRLSERALRTRVKSLSNELAVLKHGLRTTPGTYSSKQQTNKKRRSTSIDRRPAHSSIDRSGGSTERRTIRTPSPGARLPRFDPTAYVENKRKKQRDANKRLG